jgi:hypothetical protein
VRILQIVSFLAKTEEGVREGKINLEWVSEVAESSSDVFDEKFDGLWLWFDG